MKKPLLILFLALWCALPALAAHAPSSWAQEEVRAAADSALQSDYIVAQDGYQTPVTRRGFSEQIALTLALFHGQEYSLLAQTLPEGERFVDVPVTDPLSPAIQLCSALSIVSGTGQGKFEPDALLTREQAAKMLTLTAAALAPEAYDLTQWPHVRPTDEQQISPWAQQYVAFVLEHELMQGVGEGRFDPQGQLTGEQAIVICYRLAAKLSAPGLVTPQQNAWKSSCQIESVVYSIREDSLAIAYLSPHPGARVQVDSVTINGQSVPFVPSDEDFSDWGAPEEEYQNLCALRVQTALEPGRYYRVQVRVRVRAGEGYSTLRLTDSLTLLCQGWGGI